MYLNGISLLPFEGFNEWEGILTPNHLIFSSPCSYAKLQAAKRKPKPVYRDDSCFFPHLILIKNWHVCDALDIN